MLGAIAGDIIGSVYEWNNIKEMDFPLFTEDSHFTDDTVMTLAVAKWLMEDEKHTHQGLIKCMRELGNRYPNAGYGNLFREWLHSDNPQPYNSWGNGSAMRVSPIGLYANSLEEALSLAMISAEVTHNHPEAIKGAQAIAACTFLYKEKTASPEWAEKWGAKTKIKEYVTKYFGYNLDRKIAEIREDYHFDVSCQGSVPEAIIAFLEGKNSENVIRMAISLGGDSDTIACMAASMAVVGDYYYNCLPKEIEEECLKRLPSDLIEILNDFEYFISHPIAHSFKITGTNIYAGEYLGSSIEDIARRNIEHLIHFGITDIIDLTDISKSCSYEQWLPKAIACHHYSIKGASVSHSIKNILMLFNKIEMILNENSRKLYIYSNRDLEELEKVLGCWYGRNANMDLDYVLECLKESLKRCPSLKYCIVPEMEEVSCFIEHFISCQLSCRQSLFDKVEGSLVGGAVGDALGSPVKFMTHEQIRQKYGEEGIVRYELDEKGIAKISDDTQMVLFTANGILFGITREIVRGIMGPVPGYVEDAYLEWLQTQTGFRDKNEEWHTCWLRDVSDLNSCRYPDNTCLDALQMLSDGQKVLNCSKSYGGIMRVAPMGLYAASSRIQCCDSDNIKEIDFSGAEIANITHKHPLGFLPAAVLTHVVYRLACLDSKMAKLMMEEIVEEALELLPLIMLPNGKIARRLYFKEIELFTKLIKKAIRLSHCKLQDVRAISILGEGWNADEALAIAIYCSLKYKENFVKAVTVSVNHSGNSDTTGAITGNIIGAALGGKAIPAYYTERLELLSTLKEIAEDLSTDCFGDEDEIDDTEEKKYWLKKYVYARH